MGKRLDPNSRIPLYMQIRNQFLAKIEAGDWVEGDRLPTEEALQRQYRVSRATIRQALDDIERDGIISRRRGAGTIVSHKRIKPEIMKLTSFTEDMISRGLQPQSKTVEIDFVLPAPKVLEGFGMKVPEKLWFVRRLRLANNKPLGVHDLYIPPELTFSPRELSTMQSYYELLRERHGLAPVRAAETLTAAGASKSEGAILKVPERTPLLVIWRTTYGESDRILEVVRLAYIAERYEYRAQLYV
jgi:GntR family transcriptional regulator